MRVLNCGELSPVFSLSSFFFFFRVTLRGKSARTLTVASAELPEPGRDLRIRLLGPATADTNPLTPLHDLHSDSLLQSRVCVR